MHEIKNQNGYTVTYDQHPDFCPVCHRSAQIDLISQHAHEFPEAAQDENNNIQLLYQCPRKACGSRFILEYGSQYIGQGSFVYVARRIYPNNPKPFEITDGIKEISPSFLEIASQADQANSDGLSEIAGIGYRKALEFLIKDYCIHLNVEKEDEIKRSTLNQCITNYVTDTNLKNCAKRAAWLGNDEAHYTRKWEAHDIDDLITLIKLTMHWISHEILTAKYMSELEEG